MKERRKSPRLDEDNEVTINLISKMNDHHQEGIMYNRIKNISASGVKIQTNVLLPIDTLLNVHFNLKTLEQTITAIAKVKWIRNIMASANYEAGLEFVNAPIHSLQQLEDYILWQKNNNKF